jgi:WD40 repeat protein
MWAYCAGGSIVLVHPPTTTNSETIQETAGPAASKNGADGNLAAIPDLKAQTSKRISGRWPTFSLIATQIEKYNAISFCQNSWDYLPIPGSPLVSGCERGIVRVWNLENNSTMIYHDNHLVSCCCCKINKKVVN